MSAEDGDGERPAGPAGPDPDAGAEALALAGWEAGRTLREIAVELFGADLGPVSGAGGVDAE